MSPAPDSVAVPVRVDVQHKYVLTPGVYRLLDFLPYEDFTSTKRDDLLEEVAQYCADEAARGRSLAAEFREQRLKHWKREARGHEAQVEAFEEVAALIDRLQARGTG